VKDGDPSTCMTSESEASFRCTPQAQLCHHTVVQEWAVPQYSQKKQMGVFSRGVVLLWRTPLTLSSMNFPCSD
jgi:hypothetical protein